MRRILCILGLMLCCIRPAFSASHPEWTTPQQPFRIADNLYYVGSQDLAAYLITTPRGNILINGSLASSPAQIRASIEQLGFHWADTRILLNSHAHFDHAAGDAEILRETGAQLMAMDGDADVLESGGASDFDHLPRFAPAHVSRILHDGDTVTLGDTTLTAHKTAGHTRGCTTWTLNTTAQGRVRHVVIVGGWSALDEYHLTNPESYPGIAADFKKTFRTLHALPCDIFLGAHGLYFNMQQKLAQLPQKGPSVWIDPTGYQAAVSNAERNFRHKLHQQETSR